MESEAADEKTLVEKRSAPLREEDDDDERVVAELEDDPDEEEDGDLMKVGLLDDDDAGLEGERPGSDAPASLYKPSLLRKSWIRQEVAHNEH